MVWAILARGTVFRLMTRSAMWALGSKPPAGQLCSAILDKVAGFDFGCCWLYSTRALSVNLSRLLDTPTNQAAGQFCAVLVIVMFEFGMFFKFARQLGHLLEQLCALRN